MGFRPFERALAQWWAVRLPLARIAPTRRDRREGAAALAFWIAKAEADPWTFEDLQAFTGKLLDAGEPFPPALDAWAREVAAGRRTMPNRQTGERTDPLRDLAVATAAENASARELAGRFNMSKSAVSKASKRGRAYLLRVSRNSGPNSGTHTG